MTQKTGYGQALNEKASEMDNQDLIDLFEYAYRKNYTIACNVIAQIMSDRDLMYKDDNGRWHKNY